MASLTNPFGLLRRYGFGEGGGGRDAERRGRAGGAAVEQLESRQLLSVNISPASDPGSTLSSAYVIRNSNGSSDLLSDINHGRYIVSQSLSSADKVDYYRFTLATAKRVNVSLTGFSQNLNVELRDSSARVLNFSRNGGTAAERFTSARLAAGTYYVRVGYAGAAGARSSYRLTLSSGANWVMVWGYSNQVHHVGLVPMDGAQTIAAGTRAWVLVHGLDSNPSIFRLASGLVSALSSTGTPLAVDWSTAATNATSVPWISQVGQKIGQMLKNTYGITGSKLGVIGHSWGTYVGYEIGRGIGGNSAIGKLVAIDPGRVAPGYSGFSSVDFRTYSTWSWGFYARDLFGNADKAATADEAFIMNFSGMDDLSKHVAALTAFGKMQSTPSNKVAALFSVTKITPRTPPWKLNQFTSSGSRGSGPFEGVLTISSSNLLPTSFRYVTRGGTATTVFA